MNGWDVLAVAIFGAVAVSQLILLGVIAVALISTFTTGAEIEQRGEEGAK